MRAGVLGDTGDGKTLFVTDLMLDLHKNEDYKISCNWELKGVDYTFIDNLNFMRDIDNKEKNVIGIDELGEISTGSYMNNLVKIVSQSRKTAGEDQYMFFIAQIRGQGSTDLFSLLDFKIYPQCFNRDPINKKPKFVIADWFKKIKRSDPVRFLKYNAFLHQDLRVRYVYDTCDLYTTDKVVSHMKDGRVTDYVKKYPQFIGSKGQLKNLAVILGENEGLNISESERMARKVILSGLLEEQGEIKNEG